MICRCGSPLSPPLDLRRHRCGACGLIYDRESDAYGPTEGGRPPSPLPSETPFDDYPVHWAYPQDDLDRIRWGLTPADMGDKWYAYVTGDELFFLRSWTGSLCYKVGLAPTGIHLVGIGRTLPHPDWHLSYVRWLVEYRLVGRDWDFPIPPGTEEPDRCAACRQDLRWNADAKSWHCDACPETYFLCVYCRKPSWREELRQRRCGTATCPAFGVPWRRCERCRDFRELEVDPSGYSLCVTALCYSGFTVVECPLCREFHPAAVGTCIQPGCALAFRERVRCSSCQRETQVKESGICLNPECGTQGP
jgi:rubredoxin